MNLSRRALLTGVTGLAASAVAGKAEAKPPLGRGLKPKPRTHVKAFSDGVGLREYSIVVGPSVVGDPMPTPENTGPSGSLTTHSGDYVASTDDATIEDLHITGNLYLRANNLTATNCLVDGEISINAGPGGTYYQPPYSNMTISYCETGFIGSIGGDTVLIDHCRFGNVASAFMVFPELDDVGLGLITASGFRVQHCLFDRLVSLGPGDAHVEAVQWRGVTDSSFYNCYFDYSPPDADTAGQTTAVISLVPWTTAPDTVTVDKCWFIGGSVYQVYFIASNGVFTNNKFFTFNIPGGGTSSALYPASGYNAQDLAPYGGSYPKFIQGGNTLDGAPISFPNEGL